uniref:Uncharacterized protein n=1 Tax=Tanacetum cinerariifolium TaxID=118510 RepID=A0A6L2JIR6_TANCI|nr:hypothetical protein [Tanacetum cinerariifolium]
MAKLILNEAQTEQYLSKPCIKCNKKYELSEELSKELRSNSYSGRVEEDVIGHIAKILEECKKMVDERGSWKNQHMGRVDKNVKNGLWEFYVNGRTKGTIDDLVNYNESCDESNKKTCSDSFFKPYLDAQDGKDIYEVIDRDYSPIPIPAHHNISNPNRLCQTKEFAVVRYLVGSSKEYITVGPIKISTMEKTPGIMSCIYHELFNKKDHGWAITRCKSNNLYGVSNSSGYDL